MVNEINTIEEARAEILRLQEELNTLANERDSARETLNETERRLQEVRDLNHKYFLRLTTPTDPDPDDGDDETPPTCEEFALTLKI